MSSGCEGMAREDGSVVDTRRRTCNEWDVRRVEQSGMEETEVVVLKSDAGVKLRVGSGRDCNEAGLGMQKRDSRRSKWRVKLRSDLVAMLFDASRSMWAGADTQVDGLGGGLDGMDSIFQVSWSREDRTGGGKRFDCRHGAHRPAQQFSRQEKWLERF